MLVAAAAEALTSPASRRRRPSAAPSALPAVSLTVRARDARKGRGVAPITYRKSLCRRAGAVSVGGGRKAR